MPIQEKETVVPVFAFRKGFSQVEKADVLDVKHRIMKRLGITTDTNFYRRMNGEVEPRVTEHKDIEEIFAKYGITEIWGE